MSAQLSLIRTKVIVVSGLLKSCPSCGCLVDVLLMILLFSCLILSLSLSISQIDPYGTPDFCSSGIALALLQVLVRFVNSRGKVDQQSLSATMYRYPSFQERPAKFADEPLCQF